MVRLLSVSLFLLSLSASATWGISLPGINIGWGNHGGWNRPQQVWAYQGQSCSYYQGYGPQCVPGLVCMNAGFNVGFGVCQQPGGWNNGGYNNGGWNYGGHHGGGHGGCRH